MKRKMTRQRCRAEFFDAQDAAGVKPRALIFKMHHIVVELILERVACCLQKWRAERSWSQATLADRLGVGIATIKRAELAPDKPLGSVLTTALSRFK